jgi:hypothetical protein
MDGGEGDDAAQTILERLGRLSHRTAISSTAAGSGGAGVFAKLADERNTNNSQRVMKRCIS